MTAATVPSTTMDMLTRRRRLELNTPRCPACILPLWSGYRTHRFHDVTERTEGSACGRREPRGFRSTSLLVYIQTNRMYTVSMSIVSVAAARNNFSDLITRSQTEAVFIERRGQRAAVVVSPERYELMLEALEDAEDVAAFDEAMTEEGPNIPWAQVKADLGWV